MPRSGDTFTRVPGSTAIQGATINPAIHNAEQDDIADALTKSARLSRLLDIAGDLQSTGTNAAYAIASHAGYVGLVNGLTIAFRAHVASTNSPTLNLDSIGTAPLRKVLPTGEAPIAVNDLLAGGHYVAVYDSAANTGSGAWLIVSGLAIPASGGGSGITLGNATALAIAL